MAKRGRELKYNDTFPEIAKKLAADGKREYKIAEELGISQRTYFEYKAKYPHFSQAIKSGQQEAIQTAEDSLFRRVTGFTYTETVIEEEMGTVIKTKKTKKTVLPDPVSCIFYLKNKDPENWRDRQELSIPDGIGVKIINDIQ